MLLFYLALLMLAVGCLASPSLEVVFRTDESNVTVCGDPTVVFEGRTITLRPHDDVVQQVGGYYTQNVPVLNWDADPNAFYTLLMLDPDAFYCNKGTKIHWSVFNIPGSNITAGDDVVAFAHPGPPAMRFHRYIILLHQQSSPSLKLTDSEVASLQLRSFFDYHGFCEKHGLGSAVSEVAVEAQLDAFIVQFYAGLEPAVDLCAYPASCWLDGNA